MGKLGGLANQVEGKSERLSDTVLKTDGTNSVGFDSSALRSRLYGRYYLAPIIRKLIRDGNTLEHIAELLGCSVSTIKYNREYETPNITDNFLDARFGKTDDEFLRQSAVYECCSFLLRRGWQIGITDPKCIYDVFAIKGSDTIKIQVRSSSRRSHRGWPVFSVSKVRYNTKSMRRVSYCKGDFDFWFFCSDNGDRWIIPFSAIECIAEVSMEGYDQYYIG